jgi:hypothetical protein
MQAGPPLKFMPGAKLRQWSLRAWISIYGMAAFFFVYLLLLNTNPVANVQHQHAVTTTITLFVAFGVFSTAFWAYFRCRPKPAEEALEATQETPSTQTKLRSPADGIPYTADAERVAKARHAADMDNGARPRHAAKARHAAKGRHAGRIIEETEEELYGS